MRISTNALFPQTLLALAAFAASCAPAVSQSMIPLPEIIDDDVDDKLPAAFFVNPDTFLINTSGRYALGRHGLVDRVVTQFGIGNVIRTYTITNPRPFELIPSEISAGRSLEFQYEFTENSRNAEEQLNLTLGATVETRRRLETANTLQVEGTAEYFHISDEEEYARRLFAEHRTTTHDGAQCYDENLMHPRFRFVNQVLEAGNLTVSDGNFRFDAQKEGNVNVGPVRWEEREQLNFNLNYRIRYSEDGASAFAYTFAAVCFNRDGTIRGTLTHQVRQDENLIPDRPSPCPAHPEWRGCRRSNEDFRRNQSQ